MKALLATFILAGLTYYLVILAATTIKIKSAGRRLSRTKINTDFLPPVSLLKPLNGVDGHLYNNLLSFVNQDYPEFEIIFGIQSHDDPAIEVVEQLKREFPEKKIKYIVSDRVLGYNPKVNNLYSMVPLAEHDYMVISDSNVMVADNYLRENIKYFADSNVGLVTNLIKGVGGKSVGALFENLHLNSFVIGNVSLLDITDRKIVVGKSIFFKKSQFDSLGGLWEIRNYLAEDYLMGQMYARHGYKVVVSPEIISTTNHSWTMKRFLNRHTRWAQLRWNLNKAAYLSELVLNLSLWSLIYWVASGFAYDTTLVAMLCWGTKIVGDAYLNNMLRTDIGPANCLMAPIKDLVIAFSWPVPLLNRKTNWRGNPVRITHNTLLLPSED